MRKQKSYFTQFGSRALQYFMPQECSELKLDFVLMIVIKNTSGSREKAHGHLRVTQIGSQRNEKSCQNFSSIQSYIGLKGLNSNCGCQNAGLKKIHSGNTKIPFERLENNYFFTPVGPHSLLFATQHNPTSFITLVRLKQSLWKDLALTTTHLSKHCVVIKGRTEDQPNSSSLFQLKVCWRKLYIPFNTREKLSTGISFDI